MLRLNAIAIYELKEDENHYQRFDLKDSAALDKSDLDYFQNETLPQILQYFGAPELLSDEQKAELPAILSGAVIPVVRIPKKNFLTWFGAAQEPEYYYAKYVHVPKSDTKPEMHHLHVLVFGREVDLKADVAPHYLFINVNHVDQRSEKVRTTLWDILRNPIGAAYRDIFPLAICQDIQKAKETAINTKAILGERGERLITLVKQSDELYKRSDVFKVTAEETNKKYSWCGGRC